MYCKRRFALTYTQLIQRQNICDAKTGLLLETIFIYWIDCVSIY